MARLYHSTRSIEPSVTSKQAILAGIAPDGGLYVSDSLNNLKIDLAAACTEGYHALACRVLGLLLPDFSKEEIADCVEAAYGKRFDTPLITPLVPVGDVWMLELWHGPTCAFKDVALQILPRLMSVARKDAQDDKQIMIVTATSGDTGKAALEGFADVAGTGVAVFYPKGGVSDVQRLQMVTQRGCNVAVCGIHGNFDDAQTEVKHIFADHKLAERLSQKNIALSSANSINIGRLVPQVVYYFSAYKQLIDKAVIQLGDDVEFCVPTGNFGDVLAGYYAKLLGLPISRLIVASNINDVLFDFISTGRYNRLRPFEKSLSPSMDILVSSNLERLLYYLSEGDTQLVSKLMDRLEQEGSYELPEALLCRLHELFACGRATDEQTQATIRDIWEESQVLLDTHTAVAMHVLREQTQSKGIPRVCLSTANPYKFSASVLEALGQSTEGLDGFECMQALQKFTGMPAPHQLLELKQLPERHLDLCKREQMNSYIEHTAERLLS
ncbi:threonine synthase [Olegusella massiliensis]|uniref:threonine synthase n=1 Tax=Olegusella massiliensis TaxID=1776381 RepID=UPI0023F98888|nr:threonine synthase [Olegusella massiliensis]